MKKKILIAFGTRPEAIKMAPLVKAFEKESWFKTRVCITAQHREMLDQVLDFFEIKPYYDLNLMRPNQNLYSLTAIIIESMRPVLEEYQPDFVYVHGDTTTTLAVALAAFYSGSKICHVEAGLRTFNKRNPFPEEMNRSLTGCLTDYHFAPTEIAKQNLIKENVGVNNILVTGNTVIDALQFSVHKINEENYLDKEIKKLKTEIDFSKKILLITGHRRENHGQGFLNICKALKFLAENHPEILLVYPVHLNPNVQKPVYEMLGNISNIKLIDPLNYPAFVWLMEKSYLIITDSGGIQEEAPSLGKPVLVMRNTTERPEAVAAGTVILVGIETDTIISVTEKLLKDETHYTNMTQLQNPYGDGNACKKIVDFLKKMEDEKY